MGFLSRLQGAVDKGVDLVTGAGERLINIVEAQAAAGGDLAGLASDLITAPFTDDEYDGVIDTLKGASKERLLGSEEYGPGYISHQIGPEGAFGLLIEAVPEPIREGANATFDEWERWYRQTVRVPTTAFTALNLATSQEYSTSAGSNPENLLRGDIWKRAWDTSGQEGNTLGRAISFGLFDVDVLDEAEVAHHEGTAWHNYVSGTIDTVALFTADPLVVGGKVVKGVRGAGMLGRLASRAGAPGTRNTLRVAQRHRAGGAVDRLVVRPYVKARYGRNADNVRVGVAGEALSSQVTMSPRELLLAGGRRRVANELSVQVSRRERYFAYNGRFDKLLRRVDSMLTDSANELIGAGVPVSGQQIARYSDEVYELAATRVRQRFFHDNPHGVEISNMLVRAYGGAGEFSRPGAQAAEDVMRFFLGDNSAIMRIADQSDEAANFLKGIYITEGTVRAGIIPGQVGGFANQHRIRQALMPPDPASITDDIGQLSGRFDVLDELVAPGMRNRGRDIVRQSGWYTNGITGKPFRWVFDKRAHPHVLFADTSSDLMVERMLRQAKADPADIRRVVAKWNSLDEAGRRDYWPELIEETIDGVVGRHFPNLDADDRARLIRGLADDYGESARHAADDMSRHRVGEVGLAERLENGSTGVNQTTLGLADVAMTPERLPDVGFVPDFTRFNRVARRSAWVEGPAPSRSSKASVAKLTTPVRAAAFPVRAAISKTGSVAGDRIDNALTIFSNFWKPTILLNPKWPMRVVGEEQLRMAAVIGGPDGLFNLLTSGRRDMQEAVLRSLLSEADILALDKGGDVRIALQRILGPKTTRFDPGRAVRAGVLGFMVAGGPGAVAAAAMSAARNRDIVTRLAKTITARRAALDLLAKGDDAGARAIMEAAGFENLQILGMDVRRAYGNPAKPLLEWENAAGSNRGMTYMLAHQGSQFKQREVRILGNWNDVTAPPKGLLRNNDEAVEAYRKWYERVLNDQFGRSKFSRMFFDDALDDTDIVGWLQSPDGDETLRVMGMLDAEVDELESWVDAVREFSERLLPKMDELVDLRASHASGSRIELRQVVDAFGDGVFRTVKGQPKKLHWNDFLGEVHKQEELFYSGEMFPWFKQVLDRGMKRLGGLPTTHLSRHPLFRTVYGDEMRRTIFDLQAGSGGAYTMTPAALEAAEDAARIKALDAVKSVMYELAEQSNFAESTRHFFPFFNAWQEVLTRWVGLTADNPAFVAKMGITYRESAGLPEYIDDKGNTWVQFPIPPWAKGLVEHSPLWGSALDHVEAINFNRDSINMITQGLPGFMPTVVFIAGEAAKQEPKVEELLSFMFPFGLTPSSSSGLASVGTVEQFMRSAAPAWGRSLYSSFKLQTHEWDSDLIDVWADDRSAGAAMRYIGTAWLAKMENGEIPKQDFSDPLVVEQFERDITHAAKAYMMLSAFTKLVSPASIKFTSPYQDVIDTSRRFYNENPDTADERLLEYLMEQDIEDSFFVLTARSTQSTEGLPPTMDAVETRDKYEDLYVKYPELGGLILGFDGGGSVRMRAEFLSAAYENQRASETFAGSGVKQRESFTFNEWLVDPQIRKGWAEYRVISDEFYNQLDELGLPNDRVAEAGPLRNLKMSKVEALGEDNPLWRADFETRDSNWPKRIEGMRTIADDPRFVGRADIQALGTYLDMRDEMTMILAEQSRAGKAHALDAGDNQPLRNLWEAKVGEMLINNPTFRDIHERWLEFDMLGSDTWPQNQQDMIR